MDSPSSSEQCNMHSQIKTLLDEDDTDPFFHFVNYLFSEDEAISGPADSLYVAVTKEYPNALSNMLAVAINRSPNTQTRIRCSALFSRFLAKNWQLLHPMFHKRFKTFFIRLLEDEEDFEALKIHCTSVSNMAALLFPKQDWPELLMMMLLWVSSPDSTLTKSASVILLNELIPKCPFIFIPYLNIMRFSFKRLMNQGSGDYSVRTTTVGAAVKLILYLATPSDYCQCYGLLTGMISVSGDAAFYDQGLVCSALDEMVVLARENPGFLTVHIESMAEAMLKIASDTNLKEQTRQLAVQFLVTLAEGGMIENLPSTLFEELLTVLLQMLICIKYDISWDEADIDDMDAGKTTISCYAEDALSRLAIAPGGNVIVPNSLDMLPNFFKDDDWKMRYAAVTSLGLIASGCPKMSVQYLEQSVGRIMELVHDQHPRVRWAAMHAICQFSKYLSPYFQEQCHQQVIPALSEAIDDFSNPKVQTHAASALTNFTRNCCSDILKPYLKEIIIKLLILLQKGKTFSKGTSLKALASLADSTMHDFQPFYGMVMPCLKFVLVTAKENYNCMLVAKSLECITVVAVAVGKSVFSADVEEVVKILVSLQEYNYNIGMDGQEVTSYLLQAWGRLCISLGEDFRPYLSASVPQLIESVKQEMIILADEFKCLTLCCMERMPMVNRKNEPRNIVLKEMLLACDTLGCFAAHTKGGLHLWIEKVLNAVLPLVDFKYDEQVRVAAISVMPLLLQSAAIAMENKLPIPGFLDSPIDALSKTIIPALLESLEASSIKVQVEILVSLNQCIQVANTWKPDNRAIFGCILKVLSSCFHKKTERAKNSIDFEKPDELLNDEIQDEDNVLREVYLSLQLLIKRFYARGILFQIYFVRYMWVQDTIPEKRRMAFRIFRDIAEQWRERGLRHYVGCIPSLLRACKDTNPDIQQTAACAIGIYVEYGGEAFKQHLQEGLSSLEAIFQHPGGAGLEHTMAKEAAVSAYGKVCFFLCEEINSYEYIDLWLFHLPLKCNFDEAKAAHRLLCSMIEKPESKVTGPDDGYISRIITIMAEVLWAGTNLATEETQSKMIQQLKMFKQKLADKFVAICKSLPPLLQNTLYTYLLS